MAHKHAEELLLRIYDEHSDALYRFFYFRVSDKEQALDLVQEAMMRIWNHIRSGGGIDRTKAFIFTVARRLVIDEWRKKKAVPISSLEDGDEETQFDVADPSADFVNELDYKLAVDDFKKLPEDDRELLLLRFVEDLPVKTIAEIWGERENTISVKLSRALSKLRKDFNKNG